MYWHHFTSLAFETSTAEYFSMKPRYLLKQSEGPRVMTAEREQTLLSAVWSFASMKIISGAFLPDKTAVILDSEQITVKLS